MFPNVVELLRSGQCLTFLTCCNNGTVARSVWPLGRQNVTCFHDLECNSTRSLLLGCLGQVRVLQRCPTWNLLDRGLWLAACHGPTCGCALTCKGVVVVDGNFATNFDCFFIILSFGWSDTASGCLSLGSID